MPKPESSRGGAKSRLALLLLLSFFAFPQFVPALSVGVVPAEFADARQPSLAISRTGEVHITFGQRDAIYRSVSKDRGRSFAPPELVAELPKLALGMRRGPRILCTPTTLVVTAISYADNNLHAWFSRDDGKTWKETSRINRVAGAAREGLHASVGNGAGDVVVAWHDSRNGGMQLWRSTSHDGGLTWGENAVVYQSPHGTICECCHASLAMNVKGEAVIMWRNWLNGSRDLHLARSSDGGETFGPAEKLGKGTWLLEGCPMDGGGITLDDQSRPVTIWRREKAIFTTAGESIETQITENGSQPVIAVSRGHTYSLWQSDGSLMLKKDGAEAISFAPNAGYSTVAALPDGGVMVVWETDGTLVAEVVE